MILQGLGGQRRQLLQVGPGCIITVRVGEGETKLHYFHTFFFFLFNGQNQNAREPGDRDVNAKESRDEDVKQGGKDKEELMRRENKQSRRDSFSDLQWQEVLIPPPDRRPSPASTEALEFWGKPWEHDNI